MRVKDDSTLRPPGGVTAELLSRKLSDAVRVVANGNGHGNGHGNGGSHPSRQHTLRIAGDIGAAMLADRNAGTAEHSDDVVLITEAIGEMMKVRGEDAADLLAAARLHDIGKAWVPPELLEKPGPLAPGEWELMRQHTLVGERILSSVDELHQVARLVRHSHERWDGGGYPDGLAGSEIPLGSRIIFCADAFHAIRCDRPYRAGRSARDALAEINRCAGTQFDPRVASALEHVIHERNRRPYRGGGSARLFALLMCLVLGGAGSAIARSGLLGEAPVASAQTAAVKTPPPGCGTAACPSVAGPVGGLGAVAPGTGPRPLFPGLPGQLQRATVGNPNKKTPPGKGGTPPGKHKGKGKHANNGKHKGQGKGNHGNSANVHASHGPSGTTAGGSVSTSSSSSSSAGGGSGGHASHGHSGSRSHGSRGHRGGTSTPPGNGNGNANGHYK